MTSKLFVLPLCALLITGCNSAYWETYKGHKESKAVLNDGRSWDEDAAVYVSSPTPNLNPIREVVGPQWTGKQLNEPIHIADYPFDLAVDLILRGTGIIPQFDYDMDLGLPVTLDATATVGEAIKAISARTNYSYTLSEEGIEWHKYQTKIFTFPIPGGEYSYMIGKSEQGGGATSTSGGTSGAQSMDTSAFDVDLKQFSNTKAESVNTIADALAFAKQIVGRNGNVVLSKATSSILVKTTPDKMRVVDEFMGSILDELTAQVSLEIIVVQVTTKKAGDVGVSWNAVKNVTNGQLNFIGDIAGSSFTNGTPVGFSSTTSNSTGSVDLLVNALQQQGTVSFLTEQKVLTRSGKIAELEMADIKGYLASSTISQSTELGSSTELEQGIIQSGYTLYSYAKVFNNKVALVISNRASDLDPFEKVGTEENFIQIPSMRSNRLNVNQIITDGTTVVAASVRREKSSSESSSPLSPSFLPTYVGAGKDVIDIYVLVTPRVIRSL